MARSWFRRAFLGGTLGAALLLSSTAMAQAQLTDIEKSCRMNGAIAHAIAFDRDRGISVEESQRTMQQYASSFSATAERSAYLARMVHAVYRLSGLTADEHRKLQETVCVGILTEERQQQVIDEQRIREFLAERARREESQQQAANAERIREKLAKLADRQRLAELEAEIARREAMDDIFGSKQAQPAKKPAPKKKAPQGTTLAKDPNRY